MSLGGESLGMRKSANIQCTPRLALWATSRLDLVLGHVPSFRGWGGEMIWFLLPPWGVALLSLVFHSSGLGLEGQGTVCGCAVWVFIPKGQMWLESSAAPTAQLDVGAGIMAVPEDKTQDFSQ